MDSASSSGRPENSIMSSYSRTTSYRAGSGGGGGDEVMDASINLRDDVTYGGGSEIPHHRASSARKSLVDMFLADTGGSETEDAASFVGMQQTQRGQRAKKIGMWVCLAVVLVIIFVTAPKPGFLFGSGSSSDSSSADAAAIQEEEDVEEDTSWPDTTAPSEFLAGEVEVTQPVEQPLAEVAGDGAVPALDHTDNDIQIDMNRMEAIKSYIIQKHEAFEAELRAENSPAAKSLQWMVTEDTAQVDVPGYAFNTGNSKPTSDQKHEQGIQLLQRYALAAFYFAMEPTSTDGDDAKRNLRRQLQDDSDQDRQQQFASTWATNDGSHVCDWFGVECNDDQHVVSLNVSHALLQGELIPEIFQEHALPQMTGMDVSHNNLMGVFPPHPVQNTVLTNLNMEHNRLSGNVHNVLTRLTGLVNMDVKMNRFSGEVPSDWSTVPEMGEFIPGSVIYLYYFFVECCTFFVFLVVSHTSCSFYFTLFRIRSIGWQ